MGRRKKNGADGVEQPIGPLQNTGVQTGGHPVTVVVDVEQSRRTDLTVNATLIALGSILRHEASNGWPADAVVARAFELGRTFAEYALAFNRESA